MSRLKNAVLLMALLLTSTAYSQNLISVTNLQCDSKINPLGIGVKNPHLSWEIKSSGRDTHQSAYRILVSASSENLAKNIGDIWDSGVVKSEHSVQIEYGGMALSAEKKYFWKVKIVNQSGEISPWSQTASWQMGLLSAQDWDKAQWISYENLPDSMKVVPGVHGDGDDLGNKAIKRSIVPLFRKEFRIEKKIKEAMLYISGLGQYEASINGQKNRAELFISRLDQL